MLNFIYHNPVRVIFGKNTIPQISDLIPTNAKIMMTYGGGSIKKNGVYEQVKEALGNKTLIEFGGIEANPVYETLMKAVEIGKREGVDFLLAVGGGSVLDGTKFIAAAMCFKGEDPWRIISEKLIIDGAIPLGAILTLPATGSEMNCFAVISRKATQEKLSFGDPSVYPVFSVLDPTTTYSLPLKQVRNGVVDAFVHVTEQYMTVRPNSPVQDRQSEALLMTLIEEGPLTLQNPTDYNHRSNLVWAATQALNGTIACGVPTDWATHSIGHELTALYGIDHAESLAIVLPALWKHQTKQKKEKLLQYGERIWGIRNGSDDIRIKLAIDETVRFFHSLEMPTTLKDYGISAEAASLVSQRLETRGWTKLGELGDIDPKAVEAILKLCA
ncbi:MAG: iron-containing alcohol dehydrogenase [SAR324 cluster bacterium]|uniref:Iron-containing alcohol dehydrogenase n=1 Tax=SAR324 cluster bacterium TaxID=2024889 RepID=A0A7X9FR59_9DELT|nr:iron-containing alcohol dehydrogenase [SAR324 cluster bacterium]